jgi:hypothetical protein
MPSPRGGALQRFVDDRFVVDPDRSGRLPSLRFADHERGATTLIFALFMVPLLIMTAIVVDLGLAGTVDRQLKASADVAAVAAGFFLAGDGSASPVSSPQLACEAAVNSIKSNLKDFPKTATMSPTCAGTFPSDAKLCTDANTPKRTVSSVGSGNYLLTIDYPVPAADLQDSALTNGVGADDGPSSCVRMRVTIQRNTPPIFGALVGNKGFTIRQSSVVKAGLSPNGIAVPALLLLERSNCGSLVASGQGGVRVKATVATGGWIHTDTAAGGVGAVVPNSCQGGTSCNANNYSMVGTALPASGGPSIVAEDNATSGAVGKIGTFSLYPRINGAGGCTYPSGLSKAVTADPIVSRTPVDLRYNSAYGQNGLTIAALHAEGYAATTGYGPAGYAVIAGGLCSQNNTVWQSTNVYVNCPNGFSGTNVVFRGTTFVFTGPLNVSGGYVAFPNAQRIYVRGCPTCAKAVNVASNGFLSVNSGEAVPGKFDLVSALNAATDGAANVSPAAWPTVDCLADRAGPAAGGSTVNSTILASFGGQMYVHNATANWCQTFVYIGDNTPTYAASVITAGGNCTVSLPCPSSLPPAAATFDVNSGSSPPVSWSAPNQNISGPGGASPFDGLALWTEGGTVCSIGGQGALSSSGVFFYPNCNFTYTGQANTDNPLNAQFIGRSLNMAGQGVLVLNPNPKHSIAVAAPGNVQLIR